MMKYSICAINDLNEVDLTDMIGESKAQGFGMIERLREEWNNNTNRFNKSDELLLGAFDCNRVIGIGGINHDPYHPAKRYGRIRHVYVMNEMRRKSLGTLIVEEMINRSKSAFNLITLRTPKDGAADLFYESIGFTKCSDIEWVSHIYQKC